MGSGGVFGPIRIKDLAFCRWTFQSREPGTNIKLTIAHTCYGIVAAVKPNLEV